MIRSVVLLLFAGVGHAAQAQSGDSAGAGGSRIPPTRVISTASALSKELIGSINGVRELPDGRVLLNDATRRRLIILDTLLALSRVVLDSAAGGRENYNTSGALIAFRGDTTLFVERESFTMLVIDPDGRITRVRAVPGVSNAYAATGQGSGIIPTTDARGRMIFQMRVDPVRPRNVPRGVRSLPEMPDSAFLVALDVNTRKLDTIGAVRTAKIRPVGRLNADGRFTTSYMMNPLPLVDGWAVLSDGSVAFVRGLDYRVEYLNPDGKWTSSEKLPYEWQLLSDSARAYLVDSLYTTLMRTERATYVTAVIRWVNMYRRAYPPNFSAPAGYAPPNGFAKDWSFPPGVNLPARYVYGCARNEEPTMVDGRPSCIPLPVARPGQAPSPPTMRQHMILPARELPNYKPPFLDNAVRADMDGNLWILTVRPTPVRGGPVFDVVNRQGELVDRIQVPTGFDLVGFGRGGVVFLATRSDSNVQLARVRLKAKE